MSSKNAWNFVSVGEAIPDVILEIRYYSTFNFVGRRVDGYEQPVALLTAEAASALKKASDEAVSRGYRLKIYDAYRPQQAVDHFMRWAEDLSDIRMKPYFYPGIDKSALIPGGYIAARSGHSRGSTVDLTLFDMRTQRDLDMGSPFDPAGSCPWKRSGGILRWPMSPGRIPALPFRSAAESGQENRKKERFRTFGPEAFPFFRGCFTALLCG